MVRAAKISSVTAISKRSSYNSDMEIVATKVLDVRGQVCPWPVMLTMKELRKMREGEVLEVRFDYPPSLQTIPDAVKKEGHEVLNIENSLDGYFKISIKVNKK